MQQRIFGAGSFVIPSLPQNITGRQLWPLRQTASFLLFLAAIRSHPVNYSCFCFDR